MIHLGSFVLQFPIPSIKVEPPEANDSSNKSRSMATVTVQRTKPSGKEIAGAGSSSSTSRHPGSSANKASTSAGKSSTGNVHSRSYSPTNSVVSSVESISRRVEERNTSKGIPPRRTISIPALPMIKGSRRISRFNSNESIGSAGPSHSFTVFPKLPGSNGNANNTGQAFEPQNARRDSRDNGGGGGHGSCQQPQKNKADVDDRGEKRRRLSEPVTSTGTTTNTNHRPVEGRQPGTKGPAAVATPGPAQPHARTNSGTHVASHRARWREKHENRNRSQERIDRDRGDRNRNQENRHQHNNHNHAHHNRHSSSRPPSFSKNHQQGHNRDGRKEGSYSPRKDYNSANRHDNSSRRPGPGSQSRNVQYYSRVTTELKQEQIQIKEEVIDLRQQIAIRNEEYDDSIYSINRRQDEQGSHIIHLHRENDQTKARLEKMERQIRQGQQQQQPAHNAGPATEGFKCPDCHHVLQSKSYLLRKHKGTSACIKNQIADGTRGGAAGNRTPACGKAAAARAKLNPEAIYGRFAERGSSSLGRPHWNRQEGEKSPPFNVTSRLRPPRLQKNTLRRR